MYNGFVTGLLIDVDGEALLQEPQLMPHCIIECPESVAGLIPFETLVRLVHDATEASGLFDPGDVKARLLTYRYAIAGGREEPHVHIAIRLLSGRSSDDRAQLSERVARAVCGAVPTIDFVSVEVIEIERTTYRNRAGTTPAVAGEPLMHPGVG